MATKFARIAAGLVLAGMAGTTAFAQQATSANRVSETADWSVYQESNPTECWVVSAPKETENTKDGRVVSVRRSEIQLFVLFNPTDAPKGVVTVTGGYQYASGSAVAMNIGDKKFELRSVAADDPATTKMDEREWAWSASAEADAQIIAAMKGGANAVLTARSGRGTQTKDTFSLKGFTAAVEDAAKRCSQ